jgi:mono/diheme cytochrome c family protein
VTVTNGTAEVHFAFFLTNISSGDVIINSVYTSCGCTVAKLPEQPWKVAAGTNGQIQATMNLAGKMGSITKTLTVVSDKGTKMLLVKSTIMPPAMTDATRDMNQKLALADRQAVFKGECASCHVEPARNLVGQALYEKACGICHEAEHRASMVPNLHALKNPTNADYWKNWITHGKAGTLMPAFSQAEGGILTDEQIASLVNYLTSAIPSKSASQTGAPAMKTN